MEKEKKEEKKKKTVYLLHERALLMNEYFRNQRILFTSLRSKIPSKKEIPKAKASRTSLT